MSAAAKRCLSDSGEVVTPPLVAEGIVAGTIDAPALVAGRCDRCDTVTFPLRPSCSRCGVGVPAATELPRRGTLWTFTTQEFAPKSPPYAVPSQQFQPYGVGYVRFGDLVLIEGRIEADDLSYLRIGMEMEVVLVPLTTQANELVYTFAFSPSDTE